MSWHLFWFFRLPEVYILILLGFVIISHMVAYTQVEKELFSYVDIVWAMISIEFLGFRVWAHHIFSVDLDPGTPAFFTSVELMCS